MALKISDYDGVITGPDSDYPFGQIKNDPGGTAANVKSNGDIQQFFQKIMALAAITANSDPDNVSNGYQLVQALNKLINQEPGGMANAFGAASTTPVVMSGCAVTHSGLAYTITPGWFFYNGQYVRCTGATLTILALQDIEITIGAIDGLPTTTAFAGTFSPVTDATHFIAADFITWSKSVGIDALQTAVTAVTAATTVSGWTAITPHANWNISGSAAYNKNGMGYVELRGIITNTSVASPGITIFTLPPGFRPTTTRRFAMTIYNNGLNQFEPGYIQIDTGGVATLVLQVGSAISNTNWYVYIDVINFYTA